MKDLLLDKRISLQKVLSGKRIIFLLAITKPKNIKEIEAETGLKKSIIYKYIKEFKGFGIIIEKQEKFSINPESWNLLNKFILEYNKFSKKTDYRIPSNAQILYKDNTKLLFRYDFDFDAEKTAFSKFSENGLKIYPVSTYYRIPRKKLSVKEIYSDALEMSKEYRDYMFDILFYLRHKKELIGVKNELHKDLKEHLLGYTKDYLPPIDEIREKAKDYGIKCQ
jgi:hypothetical protein